MIYDWGNTLLYVNIAALGNEVVWEIRNSMCALVTHVTLKTVAGVSFHGLFALFPIRFSCYSCRRWELKLIALSYADVIFVQMHLQNNSFFSSATAYFHSDLFNMKSYRLTQGAFVSHAKTWSALDRAKQLRTGRQLHYCLRVTDGWHRWQTCWINWQGYAKETSLRFGFPGVSRCIFSQMRCCTAVCGIWFHMLKASRRRSAIFVEGLRTWLECPMTI